MKIDSAKSPVKPQFVPFSLTLHFEAENEAAQFFAMHNHGTVCNLMNSLPHCLIRETIKENFPSVMSYYLDEHNKLCSVIR